MICIVNFREMFYGLCHSYVDEALVIQKLLCIPSFQVVICWNEFCKENEMINVKLMKKFFYLNHTNFLLSFPYLIAKTMPKFV